LIVGPYLRPSAQVQRALEDQSLCPLIFNLLSYHITVTN
jgi:hypothetical protein